jgi:hypothetical protein
VPAHLIETDAVSVSAAHPYAALLWLEFEASPTGQSIIDKYGPLRSSIFSPGSELEKVTKGKKLSLNNWNTLHKNPEWYKMVIEAFGFPRAEK